MDAVWLSNTMSEGLATTFTVVLADKAFNIARTLPDGLLSAYEKPASAPPTKPSVALPA
ncbi:hypothetical protein D3C71_1972850 [compost metagenome]